MDQKWTVFSVDNFATVNGRKGCSMSNVSQFCPQQQNLYVGEFKCSLLNLHKSVNTRNYAAFDKNTWILFNFHSTYSDKTMIVSTYTVSPDKIQHKHCLP